MREEIRRPWRLTLGLAALLLAPALPVSATGPVEDFVIQCQGNCDAVAAAIRQIDGARINYIFQNVPGMAATIPTSAAAQLQARTDVVEVSKDFAVAPPLPIDQALAADEVQALSTEELAALTASLPTNYNFNNALTGAGAFHAQGTLGNNVIVAVIDSGTANNPTVVPSLAGSIIGGENLIPPSQDPVLSATSTQNYPHGTWVGTMIAGHANFLFANTSTLARSIRQHAPTSIVACTPAIGCASTLSVVPMIGSAPAAKIYAIKTLPSNGGSSPSSRTLAAMDRVLTIRRNFDNGVPSAPLNAGCGSENNPCVYDSLPIQVVNMSLGGGTFYAGNDLKEQLTVELLEAGIVVVASAGNDGPGALTIGSPGSGRGAINVAAASTPTHERILRDIQYGFGIGSLYRPFTGIQTATFSSRGPSADGRISINITANGHASLVQSANGGISLASGTSFSGPTVAGAAALLRQRFPNATAAQIRAALLQSANPNLLADGSGAVDQGAGFLDVVAAANLLSSGQPLDLSLDTPVGSQNLKANIQGVGIVPVEFSNNSATQRVDLKPGQVAQLYVEVDNDVDQIQVSFSNITPALPASQQNQLFGDDLFVTILDSYTSFDTVVGQAFVKTDRTFTVNRPQAGFVRVAVQGDATNAGAISADVSIRRVRADIDSLTATGKVVTGQADVIQFDVPAGTASLSARLGWRFNWGGYPTNDLDLQLIAPNGTPVAGGGTVASPERVDVANPAPGRWTARVVGFAVQQTLAGPDSDHWKLWVEADGKTLKPAKK